MKFATKLLATMGAVMTLAAPMAHAADEIKIGFLVKQAEEPWFQDEWKFAEQAGTIPNDPKFGKWAGKRYYDMIVAKVSEYGK